MKLPLMIPALALFCLQGCATLSPAPAPTRTDPSLLSPCSAHLQRTLGTFGDALLDYSELLAEHRECRRKHQALADAVRPARPAVP